MLFLSTPSARRATAAPTERSTVNVISIHALREEGDALHDGDRLAYNISIHALREEGDLSMWSVCRCRWRISIHALREEGDLTMRELTAIIRYFYPRPPRGGRPRRSCCLSGNTYISIHALREEGDNGVVRRVAVLMKFLSTPSARRATFWRFSGKLPASYFYPRPPRGGRPIATVWLGPCKRISIHALREEGDREPARGGRQMNISIHALREEGDAKPQGFPWGQFSFLSTPSARRATCATRRPGRSTDISIHALREEGDAGD